MVPSGVGVRRERQRCITLMVPATSAPNPKAAKKTFIKEWIQGFPVFDSSLFFFPDIKDTIFRNVLDSNIINVHVSVEKCHP